ncbi:MAG: HEPN domain-containing protein [Synergistaceae bacterium]|jgi:HEPN domain-containing protein|nr:HEPN domain-containing protein [Synergistaceae bacterium]
MNEDRSDYWIEIAEYDLETAKAMQKTGRFLYVGFLCHQVVEKVLKSVIAKDGAMPPKVHSLIRLASLSGLADILGDDRKALINELSPLNIEARYPSQKDKLSESLNEQYCAGLVVRTEEFLSWIKEQL